MTASLILLIFLASRAIDSWVLYLSSKIIPFLGFFPYLNELYDFKLSQLASSLANFDGIHYLLIAHRGNYMSWEQAYFPLYPILIRLFDFVFHNELITGILISNFSFLIGLWLLVKYLKLISKSLNPLLVVLVIVVFPTSFFFGAIYTEGLFFLLIISVLYFLKREKYWYVGLFAILAALTRLLGIFLIIPIFIHLLNKYQSSKTKLQKYILNSENLLLFAPLIGLGIYCFYLFKSTGDPLFFLTSQPVFGANRSTNLIFLPQVVWRYLKIFFTADHNFQFYVSLYEFITFFTVSFVLLFDLLKHLKFKIINFDRVGLNIFSFVNILVPTLTGTLSSIPRYALFSLSFFIFISEIKNKTIKIIIFTLFTISHILILSLFGQGYFIG